MDEAILEEDKKIKELKLLLIRALNTTAKRTDDREKFLMVGDWVECCFPIHVIPENLREFLIATKTAFIGVLSAKMDDVSEKNYYYVKMLKVEDDFVYITYMQDEL